jgi:sortase A
MTATAATVPPPTRPTGMTRRRLIRDVSSVLIISGLLLLLDAGVTLIWQEPVTAVVALIKRSEVNKQYLSYRTHALTPLDRHALSGLSSQKKKIAFLARKLQNEVPTGAAIGTITIPKISVNNTVFQGTDTASLETGPGHYPQTSMPGLGETVAIAGHRTTYLAPFRNINELAPGDRIVLTMPYARFTYVVQYQRIVLPSDVGVIRNVGYERLVLSACNPLYSAAQRIIVFAKLAREQALGAARG